MAMNAAWNRCLTTLLLAAAVHATGTATPQRAADDAGTTTPAYSRDIARLLERRCVTCHRPGRPVPMSLRTYAEVRPWIARIRAAVDARRMPPWSADPRFGTFANDPTLTTDERTRLLHWIDAGAPQGGGSTAPAHMPETQWAHPSGRPPDIVLELPTAIGVPAEARWPTFNVYAPLPASLGIGDHFVEAVQLLPGNRRITHHSSLSVRAFPAGVSLGRAQPWPGGPLLDGLPVLTDRAAFERAAEPMPSAAAAFSSGGASHLTYYFPGNDGFVLFPAAAGKRIPAGAMLEWSLHYQTSGSAETDRHVAGLWLQRSTPAHEVLTLRIGDFHIVNGAEIVLPPGVRTNPGHAATVDLPAVCSGQPCTRPVSMLPPIPAGDGNWRVTGITPFPDDATLYSLSPHGHLRLKDMAYVLTTPQGREVTLLSVPRYDFEWQAVYRLGAPMRIEAGSTLKVIARYDNSPGNRRNPDPEHAVQWSEQSADEMFNGFVDLSIDRLGLGASAAASGVPARPLVIAAGCATRTPGGGWNLTRATSPARSTITHADATEVATARRTADENRYRLVGTAEFVDANELLATGDRAAFTTATSANVTAQLREGASVGVKGVLIGGTEPAINLVSVWPVPGSCGR